MYRGKIPAATMVRKILNAFIFLFILKKLHSIIQNTVGLSAFIWPMVLWMDSLQQLEHMAHTSSEYRTICITTFVQC
jgi:hypothetical protein